MKELSIEEKAKAYDKSIERAKQHCADYVVETIFPELKESDDEKIINLLKMIVEKWHNVGYTDYVMDTPKSDIIDWLKKQGEQNTTKDYSTLEITDVVRQALQECESFRNIRAEVYAARVGATVEKLIKKQGEQQDVSIQINPSEYINDMGGNGCYLKSTDKIEPKFKVKYAGSEYNVLEVRDIAGVTYYGIEDEPNHIDYVKAENCEIISGYAIKENGSPYPTNPAVFSEQNPAWSEEDDEHLERILKELENQRQRPLNSPYLDKIESDYNWLKSLKDRYTWKPSDEQMERLKGTINSLPHQGVLYSLYQDLKKLKA